MSKSVLVVAAHPDDETLGCGAAMAMHTSNKDMVSVITMTGGTASRDGFLVADEIARTEAATNAINSLGASWVGIGEFPDNQLDTIPLLEIVKFIETKSDVEILAIGIGHDVSRYYNKAIKITDVNELGDVMISQLSGLFDNKKKLH